MATAAEVAKPKGQVDVFRASRQGWSPGGLESIEMRRRKFVGTFERVVLDVAMGVALAIAERRLRRGQARRRT